MKVEQLKDNLEDIFKKLGLELDHFRLGKTKVHLMNTLVYQPTSLSSSIFLWNLLMQSFSHFSCQVFFREAAYNILRSKIDDEFLRRVSVLQGWFRALHYRKQFLQKRAAATLLQVLERFRFDFLI